MTIAVNVDGIGRDHAASCWMLMAWPLIIRRFFSDRQFADLLAGDDAPRPPPRARRRPDQPRLAAARARAAQRVVPASRSCSVGDGGGDCAVLARARRPRRHALDLVDRRPRRAAGVGRLRADPHEPAEPHHRDACSASIGARVDDLHQLADDPGLEAHARRDEPVERVAMSARSRSRSSSRSRRSCSSTARSRRPRARGSARHRPR